MDWLNFVKERIGTAPMPMAEVFAFELLEADAGRVAARAKPSAQHYNPLGVVQGGFASTVLDIALGLVSLSVLHAGAKGVATTDLTVRYLRPVYESEDWMRVDASVLHAGKTLVVAEARLSNPSGKLCAVAQSNSLVT